jgi:hypothetical protein
MKRPEVAAKNTALRVGGKLPPVTDETKRKISAAVKGRVFSEQHRANISAARKGIVFSDEHKRKLSDSTRNRRKSK